MPLVCDYRASDKNHVLVKLPYRGPGISLSAVSCKFGFSGMTVDVPWAVCGQNHSAKQPSRRTIEEECSRVRGKFNRLTLARITISRPPRARRCRTGSGEYASHYIPHVTAFLNMSILCCAGPGSGWSKPALDVFIPLGRAEWTSPSLAKLIVLPVEYT